MTVLFIYRMCCIVSNCTMTVLHSVQLHYDCVVYLSTLYQLYWLCSISDSMICYWCIGREASVVCFKILSQHLPGTTKENHENRSQDSRFPGRVLNPELSKWEAEVSATRPRCLVWLCCFVSYLMTFFNYIGYLVSNFRVIVKLRNNAVVVWAYFITETPERNKKYSTTVVAVRVENRTWDLPNTSENFWRVNRDVR
jgi:hypothetical protein